MKTKYFKGVVKLLSSIEVSNQKQSSISFDLAMQKIIMLVKGQSRRGNKLIFIGNGGSASIASHMVTDFLKNAGIPAVAFNDISLITCISNDLGYEQVFTKPISLLARKGDILFAISSSGKSRNILNAVMMAKRKGCSIVTLSGFSKDNPLREMGEINFYTPSDSYGDVEIAHLSICHALVDAVIPRQKTLG